MPGTNASVEESDDQVACVRRMMPVTIQISGFFLDELFSATEIWDVSHCFAVSDLSVTLKKNFAGLKIMGEMLANGACRRLDGKEKSWGSVLFYLDLYSFRSGCYAVFMPSLRVGGGGIFAKCECEVFEGCGGCPEGCGLGGAVRVSLDVRRSELFGGKFYSVYAFSTYGS